MLKGCCQGWTTQKVGPQHLLTANVRTCIKHVVSNHTGMRASECTQMLKGCCQRWDWTTQKVCPQHSLTTYVRTCVKHVVSEDM